MNEAASYGLIVEGPYDKAFYAALIPRVCSAALHLTVRVCNGVSNLMKQFPALLADFEHTRHGRPVDKALVVRDSRGPDAHGALRRMQDKIKMRAYSFPRGVQLCVVFREMETWLLADANALNAIASSRGGRNVSDVKGSPEDIQDPKTRLRSLLSEARIEYTPQVCAEIAASLSIDALAARCPSFRTFKQKVLDC